MGGHLLHENTFTFPVHSIPSTVLLQERKRGARGWSYPRSQVSPWDGPPSVGSWLHAGKNSRVSHSKVKEGLFREIHTL